jgi:hypothetical protein
MKGRNKSKTAKPPWSNKTIMYVKSINQELLIEPLKIYDHPQIQTNEGIWAWGNYQVLSSGGIKQ